MKRYPELIEGVKKQIYIVTGSTPIAILKLGGGGSIFKNAIGNGGVFFNYASPFFNLFLMFCVYIIFSRKLNRYYVGTTDDFVKRLAEHNDIKHPGSLHHEEFLGNLTY
ncbi:MAG: GIY-YIG nuclease family protein [Bacteroidetes bacterium]|nr:GIY-YIG nuclease family protein [Bacteroidota bacterium]